MQARPVQPAAGSSLLEDDQAAYPYVMSQAVGGALVSATDHMDALGTLIQDAHIVHARAPFTLLRAALENSATAVWLLAPADRKERLLRRLRLQWADYLDKENAERLFIADPRPSRADRQTELQEIARACGLADEQITAVTAGKAGFRAIVGTAAREAPGCPFTDRQAVYCWMAASGIAHAQRWAVFSPVLARVEVPGAPEGSTGLALSVDEKALTGIASITSQMMLEGWRLPGERRRRYLG
jgi:hypothetical protein